MKNKIVLTQLIFMIPTMFLLTGCNRSTRQETKIKQPPPPAVVEAIKTLRKIEAATQVGVNYLQYSQLIIEAKAQVNEASAVLPNGELKGEIYAAMDAYADAGLVWNEQVQGMRNLYGDLEPGKTLRTKYSLKSADVISARNTILEAGHSHLARALELLQE